MEQRSQELQLVRAPRHAGRRVPSRCALRDGASHVMTKNPCSGRLFTTRWVCRGLHHSSPSGTTPATCSGVKGGRERSSRLWNAQNKCTM